MLFNIFISSYCLPKAREAINHTFLSIVSTLLTPYRHFYSPPFSQNSPCSIHQDGLTSPSILMHYQPTMSMSSKPAKNHGTPFQLDLSFSRRYTPSPLRVQFQENRALSEGQTNPSSLSVTPFASDRGATTKMASIQYFHTSLMLSCPGIIYLFNFPQPASSQSKHSIFYSQTERMTFSSMISNPFHLHSSPVLLLLLLLPLFLLNPISSSFSFFSLSICLKAGVERPG